MRYLLFLVVFWTLFILGCGNDASVDKAASLGYRIRVIGVSSGQMEYEADSYRFHTDSIWFNRKDTNEPIRIRGDWIVEPIRHTFDVTFTDGNWKSEKP